MSTTAYIPLNASTLSPATQSQPLPPFVRPCSDPSQRLKDVLSAVKKAKRIVVVCGAGISVEAGIPDFRSGDGLFQSLKRDNPSQALSSGKDLFHASVFKTPATMALFNTMIANLSEMSSRAAPTSFHTVLKALDQKGKLLRVYTQNIDSLEERAGLSYGVPDWGEQRVRARPGGRDTKSKGKGKEVVTTAAHFVGPFLDDDDPSASSASSSVSPTPDEPFSGSSSSSDPSPSKRIGNITPLIPRCVPLHGDLRELHCLSCSHVEPLASHLATLAAGSSVVCSSCVDLESTRRLVGKRERGIWHLRPSVVLYGETHRHAEVLGECVRRDLMGIKSRGRTLLTPAKRQRKAAAPITTPGRVKNNTQPDLLIVAGTSLKIPGTRRIVREFSKAVRSSTIPNTTPPSSHHQLRRRPNIQSDGNAPSSQNETNSGDSPIKTIFLNLEFPLPARDWENVFDVWVQGDIQVLADMLQNEFSHDEELTAQRALVKEERLKKKADREDEKKRKVVLAKDLDSLEITTPPKKRQKQAAAALPTPPPTVSKHQPPKSFSVHPYSQTPLKRVKSPVTPPRKTLLHISPKHVEVDSLGARRMVDILRFPTHHNRPPFSLSSTSTSPEAEIPALAASPCSLVGSDTHR